jgi:hypothetical protein
VRGLPAGVPWIGDTNPDLRVNTRSFLCVVFGRVTGCLCEGGSGNGLEVVHFAGTIVSSHTACPANPVTKPPTLAFALACALPARNRSPALFQALSTLVIHLTCDRLFSA